MKKLKVLFVCLAAVSIGIGVSAFKQETKKAQTNTEQAVFNNWYEFTGDVEDILQVKNASYYVYRAAAPSCSDDTYICGVYAPGPSGTGQHPNAFSNDLKNDLEIAFETGVVTDEILMRD